MVSMLHRKLWRDLRGTSGWKNLKVLLQAVRKELSAAFGDTVSVQTFSGESKLGVDEARSVVNAWLDL